MRIQWLLRSGLGLGLFLLIGSSVNGRTDESADFERKLSAKDLKPATEEVFIYSATLAEIDFSVDVDFGPIGLPGSGVWLEESLPQAAEDDFYLSPPWGNNIKTFDENIPPPGGPWIPALNLGTLHGENTDAYCFGWNQYTFPYNWYSPIAVGWNPLSLDAAVRSASIYVQFAVNTDTVGLNPSAVFTESSKVPSEEGGDIFESLAPGLSNSLVADEGAIGLSAAPEDDVNALVIPDKHLGGMTPNFVNLNLLVDTNGDGLFDAPFIFFSIKNGGMFGALVGADIEWTATWTGAPVLNPAWRAVELGLRAGLDEIDALYIENPDGASGSPTLIYFSLARGSQSLLADKNPMTIDPISNPFNGFGEGADPGDILGVVPWGPAGGGAMMPPRFGPVVVIPAGTLGLVSDSDPSKDLIDDDLNGLHMTLRRFGLKPVEPPTPTPTDSETSTPTSTDTPTPTQTGEVTPTETLPPTDTYTMTATPTGTHTETPTPSGTPTESPTGSLTETPTDTPTGEATPTETETPTSTATGTLTISPTPTSTSTGTLTETATPTGSEELTPTRTETATSTGTLSPTATETETGDLTPTVTSTPRDYDVRPTPLDRFIDSRDLLEWVQRVRDGSDENFDLFDFCRYWNHSMETTKEVDR